MGEARRRQQRKVHNEHQVAGWMARLEAGELEVAGPLADIAAGEPWRLPAEERVPVCLSAMIAQDLAAWDEAPPGGRDELAARLLGVAQFLTFCRVQGALDQRIAAAVAWDDEENEAALLPLYSALDGVAAALMLPLLDAPCVPLLLEYPLRWYGEAHGYPPDDAACPAPDAGRVWALLDGLCESLSVKRPPASERVRCLGLGSAETGLELVAGQALRVQVDALLRWEAQ